MIKLFKLPSLIAFAAILFAGFAPLKAADIEAVYNKYLQGDYLGAKEELQVLIDSTHEGEEYASMKEQLGARALLELSQNRTLQKEMEVFNAYAWQYERSQFRNPRRIKFFLKSYLEDDSTRHKSVPNLLAAGQYAIPYILEHMKSTEDQLAFRGLAHQILIRMGGEAVPALLAATFTNDTILAVNIIRILGKSSDDRAIPYLLRLRQYSKDKLVQNELDLVLPQFKIPEGMTTSRAFIAEVSRYLKADTQAYLESISSDGLLWNYDVEQEALISANPLKLEFEFRPQIPRAVWTLFKAELLHSHFGIPNDLPDYEKQALYASLVCTWAAQEYQISGMLAGEDLSPLMGVEEGLKNYLDRRSERLKVSHWLGNDILLKALDMSLLSYQEDISSRIMKMLSIYKPSNLLTIKINSHLTGTEVMPVKNALKHPKELNRYWAAIASARCQKSFPKEDGDLIMDLLMQASDETDLKSILMVSDTDPITDAMKMSLENLGYKVYMRKTGYDALDAIREFPSKDCIILNPNLNEGTLSSLHFVNMLRADYKGKDIPLGILTNNEDKARNLSVYQDFAQQLIVEDDNSAILRDKIDGLIRSNDKLVMGKDVSSVVSIEALTSLESLDPKFVANYPKLIDHLLGIIAAPEHKEESQLSALRLLKAFGINAIKASPLLLRKLDDSEVEQHYKLEVLSTLLEVSHSHKGVREALFDIVSDTAMPELFKERAASFLALEQKDITLEERVAFIQGFFSAQLKPLDE
ncbi:MAG: hypothetical protein HQL32_10645 [Planctomycetes bacterium]|nr:hypothetical protein [Planctomycetota bacterium]